MVKRAIALLLVWALPAAASAGPLKDAVARAAHDAALVQADATSRSRTRVWTGIALIAGGGVLAALGGLEIGDDERGPDDGEDFDNSDDGEDADGWGNTALLGGGIAAATVGGILLLTGRKSGPVVSAQPGRMSIRHTIRF